MSTPNTATRIAGLERKVEDLVLAFAEQHEKITSLQEQVALLEKRKGGFGPQREVRACGHSKPLGKYGCPECFSLAVKQHGSHAAACAALGIEYADPRARFQENAPAQRPAQNQRSAPRTAPPARQAPQAPAPTQAPPAPRGQRNFRRPRG